MSKKFNESIRIKNLIVLKASDVTFLKSFKKKFVETAHEINYFLCGLFNF